MDGTLYIHGENILKTCSQHSGAAYSCSAESPGVQVRTAVSLRFFARALCAGLLHGGIKHMTPQANIATATLQQLLPALLARQLDMVSHDDLVAAWKVWLPDRARSLTRIMVELEFLQPEARRLLDALCAHQVQKLRGAVSHSLAGLLCLDAVPTVLQTLCAADRELAAQIPEIMAQLHTRQVRVDPIDETSELGMPAVEPVQRYRVLRPLAVGGVGLVALADDVQLHRQVALKEIQRRMAHDPISRERFVQEAEITGQLEHPGVVPVYSLGTHLDGRPFYTMRYVQGETLYAAIQRFHNPTAQRLPAQRRLEFRKLLNHFIAVCEVIAYAHARGVLHRDIKPANVLLGKFGETLVVDWGLAKKLRPPAAMPAAASTDTLSASAQHAPTVTMMGQVVGTPAYMSPEQAAGQIDLIDTASDIYSLGATLYELLTGRAPFVTMSADVFVRIQRGDFPAPSALRRDVPAALNAICKKALALYPAARYADAQELVRDIERWLADEPVDIYPETIRERLARWGRSHKAAVAEWTALAVTALLALSINLFAMHQERGELRQAQDAVAAHAAGLQHERIQRTALLQNVRKHLKHSAATALVAGDHAHAAKIAEDLADAEMEASDAWEAGCVLSQCARLAALKLELADAYTKRAVVYLHRALVQGYVGDRSRLSGPDSAPFRTHADFLELIRLFPVLQD